MTTWTEESAVSTTWTESVGQQLETLYDGSHIYNVSVLGQEGYYYDQGGISWNTASSVSTAWTEA